MCEREGRIVAAEEVDHILTIADRPDLRLDPNNLRSLCHQCHAKVTAEYYAIRRRRS